jgi:hypothetical protein
MSEKLRLGCGQEFRDSRQITSYEFDTFTVHLSAFQTCVIIVKDDLVSEPAKLTGFSIIERQGAWLITEYANTTPH